MMNFAKSVKSIEASGIRKMFDAAGPNAINLGIGQPDFITPKNIRKAAIKAINDGKTGYTSTGGIIELREAVANKLKTENGLDYDGSNVMITVGASGALHAAFASVIEPGDKVVFNNPGFVAYGSLTTLHGGVPDPVPLKPNLHLDVEALKEHFYDKRCKIMVLNNPANPTGMVEKPETIKAVVESAEDAGVVIVSDEVYEKFCYDDVKFVSAAKYGENVITINGVSKTYAMTGWRIGFIAGPKELIEQTLKIQQYSLASPTTISQYAALEAYTGDQSSVEEMKNEYQVRRDLVYNGLKGMGIDVIKPEGAFYIFPKIDLGDFFNIVKKDVIIVPGTAFGTKGEGYARISYATSQNDLKEALKRIETVVVDNGTDRN